MLINFALLYSAPVRFLLATPNLSGLAFSLSVRCVSLLACCTRSRALSLLAWLAAVRESCSCSCTLSGGTQALREFAAPPVRPSVRVLPLPSLPWPPFSRLACSVHLLRPPFFLPPPPSPLPPRPFSSSSRSSTTTSPFQVAGRDALHASRC